MNDIFRTAFRYSLLIVVFLGLLQRSVVEPGDKVERVRAYTRTIEFDFTSWTLDALGLKIAQVGLGAIDYVPEATHHRLVLDYLELVRQIEQKEAELNDYYANPEIPDPDAASAPLRRELAQLYEQRAANAPVVESIIQFQVSSVLADLNLTLTGQPIPPVLYHVTELPLALIVSPREVIRRDADISLRPDLTLDQQVALEEQVDNALNVSSLVVGIGGMSLYPTMVMQSSSLNWLIEVVAHEWIHNYLNLRPLGLSYMTSQELRTMNETTASIAGKEISEVVIKRFYPEFVPPPPPPLSEQGKTVPSEPEPPAFDFRAEMRLTRVTVDKLLEQGKVEEAEAYMEQRRQFFWDNGYHIRKLNQAYFAFYGAYADEPGGAAGNDPVGEAVRTLRANSESLAQFINRIAWMWSYDQLRDAVETP